VSKEQKVIFEPHPVSPERKAELRDQGYKIIDAKFDPNPKDDAPKQRRVRKNDEQVAE
jgi:4-hydroxy-3-methylbut-2-enyl diphosphate reductase IspH